VNINLLNPHVVRPVVNNDGKCIVRGCTKAATHQRPSHCAWLPYCGPHYTQAEALFGREGGRAA
jgi:hypothetical protein